MNQRGQRVKDRKCRRDECDTMIDRRNVSGLCGHHNSLKNGIYKSHYWGGLPKLLEDELLPSNWLHIYVQSGTINSPTDAAKILRKFNNINTSSFQW